MVRDKLSYWLALTFAKDIGPATVKKLISALGSPEKIFSSSPRTLAGIPDVGEARAQKIAAFEGWDRVERERSAIAALQVKVVPYTAPEYPASLRVFDDAPVLLYQKGTLVPEDCYSIAMVGSRRMSEYGRKVAHMMASGLAERGITVVSGMARGIDTTAHKGALSAGGRSIAVLGCGIDRPYPPENKALFLDLAQNGCVISEFPIGTPPNKENFPRRNRIISGLSLAVLVVEAAENSGSLITAEYALEQGKDVFAVPGNITAPNTSGSNGLIQKGAKLVRRVDDMLEELAPKLRGMLKSSGTDRAAHVHRLEITPEEGAICNVLGDEPKHVDLIARETQFPPSRLSAMLLSLEIKGVIRQIEGKRFTLA
ncbi:MAG TPA: DNA-processing protein DprA [Dissulfurispiraceae bacterium]|nr:DNA-processing protein DprA [Dissulfurispiraceae bacterium]